MNLLQITDNHDWKKIADCIPRQEQEFSLEAVKSDISVIADKQFGNLTTEDNSNLLVFPRDLHRYGDEISENCILSIRGDEITTGNVMGFVGINDTQLDIKSRFTKVDGEDFFLHYFFKKVFSINLFDIKHSTTKKPIFDFLLYRCNLCARFSNIIDFFKR